MPPSALFVKVINKLGNLGTKQEYDNRTNSKISLTNYMAITLALISLPFSIQFYCLGFHFPGILVITIVVFYLLAIVLNYIHWHNSAKVWLIIIADLAAYKYAIFFGEASGIRYVLISYVCIPFLLFELKDYKYIISCSIFCTTLFFILVSGSYENNAPYISTEVQQIIYVPILGVIIFTIIVNMFYLSYESSQYEKKLIQAYEQNKKEINEARLVIETSPYSGKENSIAQILQKQINDLQKSEDTLLKVNQNLLKTNNDLDNFVYTASHDLKAPIANLEGLINTIRIYKYNDGNEEASQIVDMMMFSIERFKNTISEFTEISKIQKDIEHGEDINIEELFDEVIFSLSNLISNSGAIIISDFKSCPQINFSKKNLRSIIYNLLSNAIKYRSPNRQLMVYVTSQKTEDGRFLLTIKDNGLGIRKDLNSKIFSMFKRVHSHVEGSGVGLYIVKRIMDNWGGQIEVESDEDQGAIFKLYF